MSTSKKAFKKPNLNIEITPETEEEKGHIENMLRASKSAKNVHELKKFNFNKIRPGVPYHQDKLLKQDKIQKLQKEKEILLSHLQVLKNGALSAIVQKDEIITKLRKIFAQSPHGLGQDREDSKMQQFQNLLQYIKDLQSQRNDLKQQAERKSKIFEKQIMEREQIIEELTHELNWSTQRIDNLQKYDELLQQKIRALQDNNQNLKYMLNQSQEILKDQRRKMSEQSQLIKNRSSDSFNIPGSDSQNGSILAHSSFRKFHTANDGSLQNQFANLSRSLDQSVIQSKINEIKNQHQIQIQDLTDFYENRIQTLKKICQNYVQLPYVPAITANNSVKAQQRNRTEDIRLITQTNDNRSNYSNFSNQAFEHMFVPSFKQKQKQKQQQKMLKKNLSMCSIKSGFSNVIQPIDQRQEMQSPKRSLRNQLMNFKTGFERDKQIEKLRQKSRKTSKISSQKSYDNQSSSSNKSNKSNNQKQSQFSYKYFEYPASNFKKNKSQLGRGNSSSSSPVTLQPISARRIRMPSSQQQNQLKQLYFDTKSTKSESNKHQREIGSNFWDKFFWFTSGTLTGGLLLTLGNKLLR